MKWGHGLVVRRSLVVAVGETPKPKKTLRAPVTLQLSGREGNPNSLFRCVLHLIAPPYLPLSSSSSFPLLLGKNVGVYTRQTASHWRSFTPPSRITCESESFSAATEGPG